MAVSRRRFIKLGTHAAFGGLLVYTLRGVLPRPSPTTASASSDAAYDRYRPEEHDWAFIIDTDKCIGCGRCVRACKLENNVPWHPSCNRTWVERYRFTKDGEVLVDSPNGGIDGFYNVGIGEDEGEGAAVDYKNGLPDHVPLPVSDEALDGPKEIEKSFFVPKLCNQCDKPPCVQVCPVGATYKTADGVVLVDQARCIGCRYCIQACPYGARYMLPDVATTPMGQVRVVDKCTWCYHRITKGQPPACVEACPVGARIFGDLRDPESEVSRILAEQRIYVLKPEMGTEPQVSYLDLDGAVR
jgi:Fe-S-cluster-containing dehydrogenase component